MPRSKRRSSSGKRWLKRARWPRLGHGPVRGGGEINYGPAPSGKGPSASSAAFVASRSLVASPGLFVHAALAPGPIGLSPVNPCCPYTASCVDDDRGSAPALATRTEPRDHEIVVPLDNESAYSNPLRGKRSHCTLLDIKPQLCGWSTICDEKPVVTRSASRRSSQASSASSNEPSPPQPPLPTTVESTPMPPGRPRQPSRSARRNDNPNHVPRPRNAFFIFRCEFTRNHAGQVKDQDRSPTPEKVLSKRAGAMWKAMSEADKKRYRDEAKEESKRHGIENPGYRYRPKRTKPPKRRTTGPISRREQVESLVQMRENSNAALAQGTPGAPQSRTSSSPEPDSPVTPRDPQHHGLAHRRSMSLPHLDMAMPSNPYSYTHTHFITPVSCSSSPGPGPQRNGRRASSSRQRSYSPNVYHIPPPDLPFDLEFAGGTPPFASFLPHGSTVSLPELSSAHGASYYDDGSSTYSTPQISPAASLYDISQPEYFAEPLPVQQQPGPSAPAFHRRQRSNTAPSATVSPLAFLSSSLSNWNGEALPSHVASGGPGTMPALTISPPDPSVSLSPGHSPIQVITEDTPFDFGYGMQAGPRPSLIAPSADIDFDRTPRRADFAPNVQDLYTPSFPVPPPGPPASLGFLPPAGGDAALAHVSPGEAYALESYSEGLGAFDIAPAIYDMSPFDDIDFSDFLHVSP